MTLIGIFPWMRYTFFDNFFPSMFSNKLPEIFNSIY